MELMQPPTPLFPDLLHAYYVDIESDKGAKWSGKVWEEYEDQTGFFPLTGIGNIGEGTPNYYHPIVFDRFPLFRKACKQCFPNEENFMDVACLYLELREAWKELDMTPPNQPDYDN